MKLKIIVAMLGLMTSHVLTAHNHTESKSKPAFLMQEIKTGFHVISGNGGNILINEGDDGVVMIDNGYLDKSESLIDQLNSHEFFPDYIINTHWHGDHSGANVEFGSDSIIIGHENVRERLSARQEVKLFNMVSEPIDKVGLPMLTFDKSMTLNANDDAFKLVHYADSHTDSDSAIFIENANIVHTGDLYFAGMFPFIDEGSKGSVANVINSLKSIVALSDNDTIIVPGHGKPKSNIAELEAYIAMLEASMESVQKFKEEGLSMEQAQEKGLNPDLVKKWGNGFINEKTWIQILYGVI